MTGRVLSEEDKDRWIESAQIKLERLESTIRDRDKTIVELILTLVQVQDDLKDIISMPPELEHPSLTLYRFDDGDMDVIKGAELRIRDTFAKVKALTVSKQEESAEDGDAN